MSKSRKWGAGNLLTCLMICSFLAACSWDSLSPFQPNVSNTSSPPVTLTVFAAASLTESFGEIKQFFEAQQPGVTVVLNFTNSQQLAQQLIDGAPADVFASADQKSMDNVIEDGRISNLQWWKFATNKLTVIFLLSNPARPTSLQDLARPGLKLVLAAKEVPAGKYTLEFLEKAARDPAFSTSFKDDVLHNVVSYENSVKSVVMKVVLGEADIGIVYDSDFWGMGERGIGEIDIPEALNITATYVIAPLTDSPNIKQAQAFVDCVLSPEGQDILEKYGFLPKPK